jgi:hypothetical protein
MWSMKHASGHLLGSLLHYQQLEQEHDDKWILLEHVCLDEVYIMYQREVSSDWHARLCGQLFER